MDATQLSAAELLTPSEQSQAVAIVEDLEGVRTAAFESDDVPATIHDCTTAGTAGHRVHNRAAHNDRNHQ